MYGIPDRLKALSAAEEQVLLALWDCKPPVSRRDIGARLAEKGWAAATVLNFLYRLEEKGWVTCAKEQNHNLYAPTVTRRAYGVYTMRQRLDTVFGGDLAQAVRALVSESGCSQSELEQAIAVLNDCPTSPLKMRIVADTIRGVEINRALGMLRFSKKAASIKLEKLLRSAIANWEQKNEGQRLEDNKLCVSEIYVNSGTMLKRIQAAPQGRAHRIRKRSNSVTIVVDKMEVKEEKNIKADGTES